MKKILLSFIALTLTGAGCALQKNTSNTVSPAVPATRMEQEKQIAPDLSNSKQVQLPGELPYTLAMSDLGRTPHPRISVTVNVPQMTHTSNTAKANKFNELIKQRINQVVKNFIEEVAIAQKSATSSTNATPVESGYDYIDVSTVLKITNSKVLSMVFYIDTYYSGAAHPNHQSFSFNYDLEKDKELLLTDLFVPKKSFIKKISEVTIETIKAESAAEKEISEEDLAWLEGGAGPDETNFHTVTIIPQGFEIEFDPYDIDSYVAGSTEILIPFDKLNEYVSPRVLQIVK